MSTVRTVVQPGWLAVSGPEVDAVVEAADRHADSLEAAAADGLVALLEALTAHGLSGAPAVAACAPTPTGFRLVVRGAAVVVLPDGTRVGAQGRMPWLDSTSTWTSPRTARWCSRLPSRSSRAAGAARPASPDRPVTEPSAEAEPEPGPRRSGAGCRSRGRSASRNPGPRRSPSRSPNPRPRLSRRTNRSRWWPPRRTPT